MARFRHPLKDMSRAKRVARYFNRTGEVLAPDLARRIRVPRLAPVSFIRFGDEVSILLSTGRREFMVSLTDDMVRSLWESPEMKDATLPRGPHVREEVAVSLIQRRLVKDSWR